MAVNFPTNPANGDTYTQNNTTWFFDGTAWSLSPSTGFSFPNNFATLNVDGTDIDATTVSDSFNFLAGSNVTLTPDVENKSITIASTATGGGGGETNENAFSNIAVNGQSTVSADTTADTVTLVSGSNIQITTNPANDEITIASTASSGSSNFSELTDATSAGLTIDKIYEHAITTLVIDNVSTSAYIVPSHYSGQNPTIYVIAGLTIAFDLSSIPGHPFEIQDSFGNPYNTGLIHVSTTGTVTTESNAQGKDSGTLYWKIPESISGTYRYQCQSHASMVGGISVKRISLI